MECKKCHEKCCKEVVFTHFTRIGKGGLYDLWDDALPTDKLAISSLLEHGFIDSVPYFGSDDKRQYKLTDDGIKLGGRELGMAWAQLTRKKQAEYQKQNQIIQDDEAYDRMTIR